MVKIFYLNRVLFEVNKNSVNPDELFNYDYIDTIDFVLFGTTNNKDRTQDTIAKNENILSDKKKSLN